MTDVCPKCSSKSIKRNGFTRHGKQNHRCLDCGRQFSLEPDVNIILEATPNIVKTDQTVTSQDDQPFHSNP